VPVCVLTMIDMTGCRWFRWVHWRLRTIRRNTRQCWPSKPQICFTKTYTRSKATYTTLGRFLTVYLFMSFNGNFLVIFLCNSLIVNSE